MFRRRWICAALGVATCTSSDPLRATPEIGPAAEPEPPADPPGGLMPLSPESLLRYREFGGGCGEEVGVWIDQYGAVRAHAVEGCAVGRAGHEPSPRHARTATLTAAQRQQLRGLLDAPALRAAPEWVEVAIPTDASRVVELLVRTPEGTRVRRFSATEVPAGFGEVVGFARERAGARAQ